MRDLSTIDIDLNAVEHNFRLMQRIVGPDCIVCPVLKADAYGLGARRIARALNHAGAEMFAVFSPEEAAALFRGAVIGDVLVLMPVREIQRTDEFYRGLMTGRLHLTVHDLDHLHDLIMLADRYAVEIPLHLELDTGLSRSGSPPEAAGEVLSRIHQHRRLRLTGIFTHFARADCDESFTRQQMEMLDAFLDQHRDKIGSEVIIHAANTHALFRDTGFHRRMVRVGWGWGGYARAGLNGGDFIHEGDELKPVIQWRSRLMLVKKLPAQSPVGYGGRFTTSRESTLGLIPVGYSSGYPPNTSSPEEDSDLTPRIGVMLPDGQIHYAPVVGAVSMDQLQIDLTDIASENESEIGIGTEVELISRDPQAPNSLPALARATGQLPYQLLCGLHPSIRRNYAAPNILIEAKSSKSSPTLPPPSLVSH